MRKIVLCMMFASCLLSCHNNACQTETESDSIIVYYYTGWIELPVRKHIADMSKLVSEHPTDTIVYLNVKKYAKLISCFDNRQYVDGGDVDCRFLIQHDSIQMSFGYPDIFHAESADTCVFGYDNYMRGFYVSADCLYFIKSICGYYNCFSKEELSLDKMINKFGIPGNYYDKLEKNKRIILPVDANIPKKNNPIKAIKASNADIKRVISSRKIVIKPQHEL